MSSDTIRAAWLRKCATLAFSMAAALAAPALAQENVRGVAEVIDADILTFGQQRVILWGVDAPEKNQICALNGAVWNCHEVALRQLQLLSGRGEVACTFHGGPDPFGRRFGTCESGGEDLNGAMVRSGFALAYEAETDAYLPDMAEAIGAGAGLWQPGVEFEEPWVVRRRDNPGGYR